MRRFREISFAIILMRTVNIIWWAGVVSLSKKWALGNPSLRKVNATLLGKWLGRLGLEKDGTWK